MIENNILQNVLEGRDSSKFQVRHTNADEDQRFSNEIEYDFMVEFIAIGPANSQPAPVDGGNSYEFEFAGLLANTYASLEFDITVLDVV